MKLSAEYYKTFGGSVLLCDDLEMCVTYVSEESFLVKHDMVMLNHAYTKCIIKKIVSINPQTFQISTDIVNPTVNLWFLATLYDHDDRPNYVAVRDEDELGVLSLTPRGDYGIVEYEINRTRGTNRLLTRLDEVLIRRAIAHYVSNIGGKSENGQEVVIQVG